MYRSSKVPVELAHSDLPDADEQITYSKLIDYGQVHLNPRITLNSTD